MRGAMLPLGHLDITAHKSGSESPVPRCLHHKHREIPARAFASGQSFARKLHTCRLSILVLKGLEYVRVEPVQQFKRPHPLARRIYLT